MEQFQTIIQKQQQFFNTGQTFSFDFRVAQLKKLKSLIIQHENAIVAALKKDLNKPSTEALLQEVWFVLQEIDFLLKHLKKWMKPKKVRTPLFLQLATSSIHFMPYGSSLIIGAWNYPFSLIFSPLVGSMSAGNCMLIKPSEYAEHTKNLIIDLINNHFDSHYLSAIDIPANEMPILLKEKFDHIFFTGGTQHGKIVMEAAAKHLTPTILELGGKNPCIVDVSANIPFAAKRIVWAKTMNAGQSCIAPDYLYVHISRKQELITELKSLMKKFTDGTIQTSTDYGRIINQHHFKRLTQLMQHGRIIEGGLTNEEKLFIAPTLIDEVSWQDPIMQQEIFGPLLPILTYENIDEVIQHIQPQPRSLALYLFTKSKDIENQIVQNIAFGNGSINDCVVQFVNVDLPFGGIGSSGMGKYHGYYSFEAFSYLKSIYKKKLLIDIQLDKPPYSETKQWCLKQIFKL